MKKFSLLPTEHVGALKESLKVMVCSRYGIWFGYRPIGHQGETVFLTSFPKFVYLLFSVC